MELGPTFIVEIGLAHGKTAYASAAPLNVLEVECSFSINEDGKSVIEYCDSDSRVKPLMASYDFYSGGCESVLQQNAEFRLLLD